jgi:hypothetical protein
MARVHSPISLRRALPALNVASATLGSMRTRTLIATGAWLLGAAAATAGSLLVVSELGEGIAASPGQQQSAAPVLNQAQASHVLPSSSPRSRSQGGTSRTGTTGGTGGTRGAGGTSATSGTVLTSSGGTVVARCATAGALLLSWSPQQGFQAGSVVRGPAATARVVFTATASTVTMAVSCSSGMPSAATTVTNAEVEDNGGGEGGGNSGPGGGGNSGPGGGGGGGGGGDG